MAIWADDPSFRIPLYKSIWTFLDFIFPPSCPGCGELGQRFCVDCSNKIEKIESDFCMKCGVVLENNLLHETNNCKEQLQSISMIRSFSLYNPPLSEAIKKLKYHRDIGIAEVLANFFVELYNKNKMDIDMVIPVPLNRKRIKERGYNQSYLLALPFSLIIKKPLKKQALYRLKETRPQVGLNRHERLINVSEAFVANPQQVKGKNILLIDDVTTTGATLEACASALKLGGANDIVGFTLARAVPTQIGFSDDLIDAVPV